MKGQQIAVIGGFAVLAFVLMSNTANAGPVDLSGLVATYGADKVQRLNNLQTALQAAGLTPMQVRLMMAQSLFETGLFTDNDWNQTATDVRNNWAGIGGAGGYRSYNDLNAFVADYIPLLQKGSAPIDATSTTDFVNRLYTNCYTGCPPETPKSQYQTGIDQYYNLLS